ncbi:D-glucuronyl C5-epimerase family protein [Patulibacter defluvii]|uniref:D-glucuronyl C5-epimerase family protein n=1 Tax=Patulibacter defluvii TaxID=3095358 RepID=UPI002A752943|nr:D-glucuronyl C5-epimerase family protein [Patulibacter sp. DM4]
MPDPTILRRRATALACVAIALPLIAAVPSPLPASPLDAAPAAAASKKKKPKKPKYTVEGELRKLRSAKSISLADYRAWRALYRDAQAKAKRLRKNGTARKELEGVIRNTEQMAARRRIDASLAPSVFLTLQVNRDWWTTRPVPPVGSRPVVPGSPLTWQYYWGEGLQIQWLGTFGTANALATTKTPEKLEQLRAIEDEALRLASRRAGGPAWQYLFDFGGGAPPWASGMAQVTAMQSLVRTSERTNDPKYRETALQAVALLRRAPTSGARLKRPAGDHILLYTFSRARVLNAFAQAVSGLHEVAAKTGDPKVSAGYVRAERELRAELRSYDTGRWSLYQLGGANATVSYHTLSRDLLRGLCKALQADEIAFAGGQPVAGAQPPAPPKPYCDMATKFTNYLAASPAGPRATSRRAGPGGDASGLVPPAPVADPGATVGGPAVSQP